MNLLDEGVDQYLRPIDLGATLWLNREVTFRASIDRKRRQRQIGTSSAIEGRLIVGSGWAFEVSGRQAALTRGVDRGSNVNICQIDWK